MFTVCPHVWYGRHSAHQVAAWALQFHRGTLGGRARVCWGQDRAQGRQARRRAWTADKEHCGWFHMEYLRCFFLHVGILKPPAHSAGITGLLLGFVVLMPRLPSHTTHTRGRQKATPNGQWNHTNEWAQGGKSQQKNMHPTGPLLVKAAALSARCTESALMA